MKRLLVEIDDDTVERLDKIAPARSRQRSAFIRAALRRALLNQVEFSVGNTLTATVGITNPGSFGNAATLSVGDDKLLSR